MARYAVLLRGINLGRARRVAMADLRELLTSEGYGNVGTLLQSGNIVLDAPDPPDALARAIEMALEKRFGFAVDVVVRTRDEVTRIVAANPLGDIADNGARYLVAFLAGPPGPALAGALSSVDAGEERFVVDGAELYVWCPGGVRESPLLAAVGKVKGTPTATVRNWNTVEKLAAML